MAIKKKEFDKLSSMKNSKLVEEVRKAKKELMEIRFDSARSGTAPAGKIRSLKKKIARAKTLIGRNSK
tara:strand:+ start:2511 stop:2714 length:204 start_codon:yes stop_codon:yes gene_type:complete